MGSDNSEQLARIERYANLILRQSGRAVRPYRADGYVNLINRYGTSKDINEHYVFQPDPQYPDELLAQYYEGNGLFAKIIDIPAEEAVSHGFELDGLADEKIETFYKEALDELDWEEVATLAGKWTRLFGGAIAVMLINDGHGLEEPLDWRNIQSIDGIRVLERAVVEPDYNSMYSYDPHDPFRTRGSRLGMPEYYRVYSRYGSFVVHDSRCLVFRNGVMPESVSNTVYQFWGTPEYVRIHRAIRDAEIAHGSAAKLLDRSVQPIYKMQNLAAELATDEGESRVLKRLQTIDMARGMMNSITIDAEGEDYDFRSFSYTGVADVIESSCNFLSALTSIPQTKLFGRSPAGMNATGESDMENYYNYVGKIQKLNLKSNLRYLLSVVFQAGVATGEIEEVPKIKIKFNPLWSLSDLEQAQLEQTKSATELTRAQIATTYIQAQVIDPSEVRKKLADTDEFDVEAMLDELDEEELEENDPSKKQQEGGMPGGMGGEMGGMPGMPGMPGGPQEGGGQPGEEQPEMGDKAPEAAPAATKLPQDMSEEEKKEAAEAKHGEKQRTATETEEQPEGEAEQREREENGQVDKPRDSEGTEEAEDEPEEEEDSAEKPLKSNGIHDIMSLREFILQHARKDAESIPKDKVKFRTGENGKAYAIDPETGRTSGLGPDIDRVGVSEKPENNAQKKPEKPGAAAKALTHFSVKDGSVEVSKKIRIKIGRNGRTVLPPQTIGEMEVFAGKGGEKPLEKGEEIAARFGGKPEEWMHVSGIGTVIGKGGVQHRAEIHWFAHDEIGQMGWKVKRWKD